MLSYSTRPFVSGGRQSVSYLISCFKDIAEIAYAYTGARSQKLDRLRIS